MCVLMCERDDVSEESRWSRTLSTPGHQSDVGGKQHVPANIRPFLIYILGTVSNTWHYTPPSVKKVKYPVVRSVFLDLPGL